MTLSIFIAGQKRLTEPYYPEQRDHVVAAILRHWDDLSRSGKINIVVDDDDGVSHIIR
jgi:hypothetical protein